MTCSRISPGVAPSLGLSRLVAGCWRLRAWNRTCSELERWIRGCIDLGVTTFDHAEVYGDYTAQESFGAALQPSWRSEVQLVTKCGVALPSTNRPDYRIRHYDASAEQLTSAVESSLRALRTDYIDLLLLHRPDWLMNPDEIAHSVGGLIRSGKILHFGISNFATHQLELLESRLEYPLVANQFQFSAGHLQPLHDGTLDQCQKRRMLPMAWSPLAGGQLLTATGEFAEKLRSVLVDIGTRQGGFRPEQIAIAWLLRHPAGVVPVLGTGNLEHLEALCAAEQISLDRQDWYEIWEASSGERLP